VAFGALLSTFLQGFRKVEDNPQNFLPKPSSKTLTQPIKGHNKKAYGFISAMLIAVPDCTTLYHHQIGNY